MKTFADVANEKEQELKENRIKSEISCLMEQHIKYSGYLTHIYKFDSSSPLSRTLERWVKYYKDRMNGIAQNLEDERQKKEGE